MKKDINTEDPAYEQSSPVTLRDDMTKSLTYRPGQRIPLIVLVVSVACSFAAWHVSKTHTDRRAKEQFVFRSQRTELAIRSQLLAYEYMLRGGIGLFMASGDVSREEWKVYIKSLSFTQHYPGVQGIGFSKYIQSDEKEEHIEHVRAEGFSDYTLSPAGQRAEYTPIMFLEPLDRLNRRALGYDMFSDPVRREAMIRARDRGRVAMSAKISLVFEVADNLQPAFATYLPLYRTGAPISTVEQRRSALRGYVHSAFRMSSFMQGLLAEDREYVELMIFDGASPSDTALLYQTDDSIRSPRFVHRSNFEFGEHSWSLVFHSSQFFEENIDSTKARVILTLGISLGLLLSNMFFLLARAKRQAAHLATMAEGLALVNGKLIEEGAGRRAAEQQLLERATELDEFNAAMTGREGRVIELKEEINQLCEELGRPVLYPPVWIQGKIS